MVHLSLSLMLLVPPLMAQDSRPASSRPAPALRLEPVTEFQVHGGSIKSCAFTPDGKRLFSLGEAGDVLVWDPETWQVLERLAQRFPGGAQLLVDPIRPRLAVTGARFFLWDLTAQRMLAEAPGPWLPGLAFSVDGRWLTHTLGPARIAVRDAASAAAEREIVWTDTMAILALAASPKEAAHVAALSADGTVRTFDVATGTLLATDKAKDPANVLTFLPDGTRLTVDLQGRAHWRELSSTPATVSTAFALGATELVLAGLTMDNAALRRIDLAKGTERLVPCGADAVTALALRPGTGQLVAGCGVEGLRVWGAGGERRDFASGHTGRVAGLAFTPDVANVVAVGRELVRHRLADGQQDRCQCVADSVVCTKTEILIWNRLGLQSWTPGKAPSEKHAAPSHRGSGKLGTLRLSPDGRTLVAAACFLHNEDLLFADFERNDWVPVPIPRSRELVFCADGDLLQVLMMGGIKRLDPQGAERGGLQIPGDQNLWQLLPHPGGKQVAAWLRTLAGGAQDQRVLLLFDLERNAKLQERSLEILSWCSLDVQMFVCSTPAGLEFVRWSDLAALERIPMPGIQCLVAAADGRHLAVADPMGVHVFRILRGVR